jgi:hypothetical protein
MKYEPLQIPGARNKNGTFDPLLVEITGLGLTDAISQLNKVIIFTLFSSFDIPSWKRTCSLHSLNPQTND